MEFAEGKAMLSAGALPYRRTGSGPVVVYLHGTAGARLSEPLRALAASYTVIVPDLSGLADKPRSAQAELVGEFIGTVSDDKVDIIGHGSGARIAAWLAVRASDRLDALVLAAPEDFARAGMDDALEAELPRIACLTLIVAGNADAVVQPDAVRLLKRRIPKSFLVYIHDAGHDIEADRPAPFLRVVSDFLQWGEGFLVRRNAA